MSSNNNACTLEGLQRGQYIEGDTNVSCDIKPEWYDQERFVRGQQFFKKHIATIGFSMHVSLFSGLSIINLLDPLVFTDASNTPEKSIKRYLMTFYHILLWLTGDIWDKNSKAYSSMKTVRGMHKYVAKGMNAKYKDKINVSQYDMALVQSGFFGAALMYPTGFGIRCSKEELEDYVFVWRVIGYRLGIEDKYNICKGNYEETYNICKEIESKCLLPALRNPPKNFDMMADAYIDGLNLLNPIKMHSKTSTLALTFNGLGCSIPFKMGLTDWLRYYFWKFYFFTAYWLPRFESFLNWRVLHSFERDIEKMHGADIAQQVKKYT